MAVTAFAQNYYSKSTGNLNALGTWGPNSDGSGTAPANFTTANRTFNIVNRTTVTLPGTWAVSGTNSKVVVGNGTSATTFTVPAAFAFTGTIDIAAASSLVLLNTTMPTIGTVGSNTTVEFGAAGGQAVASKTYSTLILSGSGSKTAANDITVSNALEINGSAVFLFNNAGFDLLGAFTTAATGSGILRTVATGSAPVPTGKIWNFNVEYTATANQNVIPGTYARNLTVGGTSIKTLQGTTSVTGNFTFSGTGTFRQNTNTSYTLNVDGDMILTDGTYDFKSTNAATGSSIINLKGNFNNTSTIFLTTSTSAKGTINFIGGTQNLTKSADGMDDIDYVVANGASLVLGSSLNLVANSNANLRGTISVQNGGTLSITSPATLTTSGSGTAASVTIAAGGKFITNNATGVTGAIAAGITRNFDNGADYEFGGASTGTIPGATMRNLTINSGSTTVVTQNITVNGALTINTNNVLNLSTFTLAGTISSTSATGTMRVQNATPFASDRTWNFTVQYDGSGQTVVPGTYGGLIVAPSSATTVNLNGTVSAGSLQVLGTSTATTLALGNSANLTVTGAITINSSSANVPATLNIGQATVAAGSIAYTATSADTRICTVTLSSGTLTVTGNIAMPGTLVRNVFSITGAGRLNLGGTISGLSAAITLHSTSTVELNGVAAQTIPFESGGFSDSFGNLIISNSAGVTLNYITAINGVLTINAGTSLNCDDDAQITGIASTAGTGLLTTACTVASPLPAGKTWEFDVTYLGASASVMGGVYKTNLTVSGTGTKTMQNTVTVNGNFLYNGTGTFRQNLNTSYVLNIDGNMETSGGTYDFRTSGTGTAVVNLKGNFTNNNTAFTRSSPTLKGTINFIGTTQQNFTKAGAALMNSIDYNISSGASLFIFSDLALNASATSGKNGSLNVLAGGSLLLPTPYAISKTGSGTFPNMVLEANSILYSNHALGLDGSLAADITKTFNAGANYYFLGESTGTFPNTTMNNLSIGNLNAAVSLTTSTNQALVVNGTLFIEPDDIFDIKGATSTLTGTFTVSAPPGDGMIRTEALNDALPPGKTWFTPVQYVANAGIQNVATGVYGHLTFSNAAVKRFGAGTYEVHYNWQSSGGEVDLITNNPTVNFVGGIAQEISDAGSNGGNGVVFRTVNFGGGTTKTLSATGNGKFSVSGGNTPGVLNVVGNTTVAAGGLLTLKSDANGYGQIGQLTTGNQVTGDVKVELFLRGGARNTRMLGSPINDAALDSSFYRQLRHAVFITGPGGAPNGFDVGTGIQPNALTMQTYNEAATMTQSQFTPMPDILPERKFASYPGIGRGAFLFFRGNRENKTGKFVSPFVTPEDVVATFAGPINSGDIEVNLSFTNNPGDTYNGYNVLSNPYPASIDLSQIERTAQVSTLFQIIKPTGGMIVWSNGVIVEQTGAADGTTANFPRVQPGQAFYMQAMATGQKVTFRETHKVTTPLGMRLLTAPVQDKLFAATPGSTSVKNEMRVLKFNLQNGINKDETAVVFAEGHGAEYGLNDAIYFSGTTVSLSTLTSDNVAMAINFMPEISQVSYVKLNVNATATGPVTLNFPDVSQLSGYNVKLVDNYLNTSVDIKTNPVYSFTIDKAVAATFGNARFVLQFEDAPVPPSVEFTVFTAMQQDATVKVDWATSKEYQSLRFEVERSADGINFVKIGEIAAAGTSNESAVYGFVDTTPLTGTNTYRLKQVFTDGSTAFSGTQVVNFVKPTVPPPNVPKQNLKVFPNPTSDYVNINVKGIRAQLNIYDLFGRKLKTSNWEMDQNIREDVRSLYFGVYVAEVKDRNTGKVIDRMVFLKKW